MAELELPSTRRVVLTLGLVAVLYAALVPVWLSGSKPYSRVVAWTATELVFPWTGVRGAVQAVDGKSVSLKYILPDMRTGKWATCRQRLLNFADVPLALAAAAGLWFLGWPRRLLAALAGVGALFACHLGLVVWSARRLSALLARTDLTPAQLDFMLPDSVVAANEFGDVSPIIALVVVAAVGFLIRPQRSISDAAP